MIKAIVSSYQSDVKWFNQYPLQSFSLSNFFFFLLKSRDAINPNQIINRY